MKSKTTIVHKKQLSLVIITPSPSFPPVVPVVCTLLVESLPEEPEKSIFDRMYKTIHSISVHNFSNKCTELLPSLLSQIFLNEDPGQYL